MLIEIIAHTPTWVFILFGALLFLGYSQTKDRELKFEKIITLPLAMILLSIFGITSAFGVMPTALIIWLVGVSLSLIIGLKLSFPKNIKYDNLKKVFCIPGSWFPMTLILGIFFLNTLLGR